MNAFKNSERGTPSTTPFLKSNGGNVGLEFVCENAVTHHQPFVLFSFGFIANVVLLASTFVFAYKLAKARTTKRLHGLKDVLRQIVDEDAPNTILNPEALRKITGTLPKWVDFSDYNRVPWLNKAAKVMWPFLDKAIASSVIWALSDVVNDLAKMSKLKIGFRTWTLGDEPPIFTAAKVLDDVEGEVTLDLEFKWVAVKPEVVLDVKAAGINLPIKLEHIEAFGVVRLVFTPLVPWWPSFDGMKIAFVDKPTIDFSLKLIGGDINTIPFVANSLRHLITNSLVDLMVWPQKIWVPMGETWERENANISGLLKIGIQSAEDLVSGTNVLERGVSAMTSLKSFVAVELNQKNARRKYTEAKGGRSPVYEEQISLRVDDIRYSKIRFTVYNSSVVGRMLKGGFDNGSKQRDNDEEQTEILNTEIGFALCDLSGFQMKDSNKTLSLTLDIEKPEIHGVASRSTQVAKAVIYSPFTILSVGARGVAAVGRKAMNVDKVEKKRETNGRLHVTLQYLPFEDRNNTNNTAGTDPTSSENNNTSTTSATVNTESAMISNYIETDAVIQKGKEYTGVLYARIIRADALRAARGINPDPYVKIKFGKQKRKTKTKVDTRRPTWEEEFEFIVDTAESSRSAIEISVWDRAPLGRKQSLGTLRLHSGDILSQCLRVFKDTGAEFMEKKFELANVPCGTLLIQFEFISVSQAPALETDIEEAKEALIQTELERLTSKKDKKTSSKEAKVATARVAADVPEKFEWRQSSPGKVVEAAPNIEPSSSSSSSQKKKKKPLGRRIASAFRSKEEKARKKMAKMQESYEESDESDEDETATLETNRNTNSLSSVPEESEDTKRKDGGAQFNRRKSLHINIEDLNKVKMGSPVSEHESVIQKRKAYYRASSKFGNSNETLKFKSALDEVLEKEEAKKQQQMQMLSSPKGKANAKNEQTLSAAVSDSSDEELEQHVEHERRRQQRLSIGAENYSSNAETSSESSFESGDSLSEFSSESDIDVANYDSTKQEKRSTLRKALRRMKREIAGKTPKHDRIRDREFYDKKKAELDAERKMEQAVPGYEWRSKNQQWKQKDITEAYVEMRGSSKAKRIEDLRKPSIAKMNNTGSKKKHKNDDTGWTKVK
jgi:hypothetical protein